MSYITHLYAVNNYILLIEHACMYKTNSKHSSEPESNSGLL